MNTEPKKNQNKLKRRDFLTLGALATAGLTVQTSLANASPQNVQALKSNSVKPQEWRNRQSEMSYRQLGRTGYMVSEFVSGGDPIRLDNYKHLNLALEKGLNYLDMAPAYGRGECEETYGKFLKESGARDKVFLNTKISGFNSLRVRLYRDIFKGLPSGKQEAIQKKAQAMREARAVDKPGYFLTYWNGQRERFEGCYLANAMMADYAHLVDGSPEFRKFIFASIEKSLTRVGTDYFDLVMCPHGADSAEEVLMPEIYEIMDELKKQGKIRALGVSTHNDPAGVLTAAAKSGQYDAAMMAYNVINGGYLDPAIDVAHEAGMGIIGMKVAMAVSNHHGIYVPDWRIQKLNHMIPGEMKPPMKAYLWALQNPKITAVISNLWDETYVNENLSLAGKKVELVES